MRAWAPWNLCLELYSFPLRCDISLRQICGEGSARLIKGLKDRIEAFRPATSDFIRLARQLPARCHQGVACQGFCNSPYSCTSLNYIEQGFPRKGVCNIRAELFTSRHIYSRSFSRTSLICRQRSPPSELPPHRCPPSSNWASRPSTFFLCRGRAVKPCNEGQALHSSGKGMPLPVLCFLFLSQKLWEVPSRCLPEWVEKEEADFASSIYFYMSIYFEYRLLTKNPRLYHYILAASAITED